MTKAEIGKRGEQCALNYLLKKGYNLITQNFSTCFGEVDIIMEDEKYIIFVEVKTRNSNAIASPKEWVTASKQKKIIKTATIYLNNNYTNKQPRFDVAEVFPYQLNGQMRAKIEYYEAAFLAE